MKVSELIELLNKVENPDKLEFAVYNEEYEIYVTQFKPSIEALEYQYNPELGEFTSSVQHLQRHQEIRDEVIDSIPNYPENPKLAIVFVLKPE